MTQDDIISMYEKANGWSPAGWDKTVKELERFANLIVAAERQRKAWDAKYWTAYEHDVAAAEREACVALCFQMWDKWIGSEDQSEFTRPDAEDCAAAIRARGQV
jgi:hypothetical protein